MQYIKQGTNTFQVINGQQVLIDASDNYDVNADGSIVPKRHVWLSKLQFRNLFSMDELVALDNFASSTTLTSDQKAYLTTLMKNVDAAESIDLCYPMTQQGLAYIESAGLIAAGRAAQILASTV